MRSLELDEEETMLMSRHRSRFQSISIAIVCSTLGLAGPATLAVAANSNPTVFPPGSNPYGASYGEWSARWWQWAFSIPVAIHPLFDNGPCDVNQAGPVFFIGGSFTGLPATRSCTVPAGEALFFPVVNAECSNVEPPPFFGADEAAMRACARSFIDGVNVLNVTIDGRSVDDIRSSYRADSPLYSFSAPAGGLFGPDPVTGMSVSDGYWIFLAPLSAGTHSIHLEAPEFGQDVTYNLTVRPGGRGRGQIAGEPATQKSTWSLVKALFR